MCARVLLFFFFLRLRCKKHVELCKLLALLCQLAGKRTNTAGFFTLRLLCFAFFSRFHVFFFFFVCCPPLADLHPFGVISFGFCNFHRIYVLSGILNCIPNRNPIHDTAIIAACICSHSRCCSNGIGICGGIPPWLPTALYINYISAGKINIFMNFLSPVVHCGVGQKMYI